MKKENTVTEKLRINIPIVLLIIILSSIIGASIYAGSWIESVNAKLKNIDTLEPRVDKNESDILKMITDIGWIRRYLEKNEK